MCIVQRSPVCRNSLGAGARPGQTILQMCDIILTFNLAGSTKAVTIVIGPISMMLIATGIVVVVGIFFSLFRNRN